MSDFVKESSGNVYKDLDYSDAESMKIKANIVSHLSKLIKEKNLTQQTVSQLTGIPQCRISQILNGHFRGISEYKLLTCLAVLGQDIEISIRPAAGGKGKIVFA